MPRAVDDPSRMGLALIDIDGTLVGAPSERQFYRYLSRHGYIGPRQALAYLLFFPRYVALGGVDTARKNKAYLSGLKTPEVESLARRFVTDVLASALYVPMLNRIRWHRERGDRLLLLSGTLDCVARAVGDLVGVPQVLATLPGQRNGRYTAGAPELHPFGSAKLTLLRQIVRAFEIDPADVTAYADSYHDLALLRAVGRPVAVRPDARLQQTARALGWEVIGDEHGPGSVLAGSASGSSR